MVRRLKKKLCLSATPVDAFSGALRQAANAVCKSRDDENRLTNLCVVSALAFRLGLLVRNNLNWDGSGLRFALDQVALSPLPATIASTKPWDTLARLSWAAASVIETDETLLQFAAVCRSGDSQGDRKAMGAYPTPPAFATEVARLALKPFTDTGIVPSVIDPSAGSGVLLVSALMQLAAGASDDEVRSIVYRMHGVEIDAASREICCLLLWIGAARGRPSLRRIADNLVVDNAITRDWWRKDQPLFDVLIMNPPWESLRHSIPSGNAQTTIRSETVDRLSTQEVVLPNMPALFTAQGKGDRNLFKAFVELAPYLLRLNGRIGALIPAAFASDLGMAQLRARYFEQFELESWTAFENLRRYFPIDGRYKFGILVGTRSGAGTKGIAVRSFCTEPREVDAKHIKLNLSMVRRLGGRHLMLPEVCGEAEVEVLTCMLEGGTPFFEEGSLGEVHYKREIDLTLGRLANKIERFETLRDLRFKRARWVHSTTKTAFVPVVEGRMVGRYDVFQKSWLYGNGRTALWEANNDRPLSKCVPQFVTQPIESKPFRVAICDVSSATNARTVRATLVPKTWVCGNTAPVLVFANEKFALAGLAVLNSLVFDWMARRVVSGLHLNKFYLASLVWPRLDECALVRLSTLAATMIKRSPRLPHCIAKFDTVRQVAAIAPNVEFYAQIEAEVEREVAMAFKIEASMLRRMLSADRTERRGLWRYFDAYPHSRKAIEIMLERYKPRRQTRTVRSNGSAIASPTALKKFAS
jgi:N-6 DNA Methylase